MPAISCAEKISMVQIKNPEENPVKNAEKIRNCPLCENVGGILVYSTKYWRVVRVSDEQAARGVPAFWRLIGQNHIAELSDLPTVAQNQLTPALIAIEKEIRQTLHPKKINIASLGNMTPHLHWHIVARFENDPWWPAPIWAAENRPENPNASAAIQKQLPELDAALARVLADLKI